MVAEGRLHQRFPVAARNRLRSTAARRDCCLASGRLLAAPTMRPGAGAFGRGPQASLLCGRAMRVIHGGNRVRGSRNGGPSPLPIPRSIFSSHKTPRRLPGLGKRRGVYCPFTGRSNTGRCPHSGRPSCGSPRGWRLAARHAFAQCHYRTIRCRHIPVFPQVGQVNRRFVKVW